MDPLLIPFTGKGLADSTQMCALPERHFETAPFDYPRKAAVKKWGMVVKDLYSCILPYRQKPE
jgi:hypothetical protein